jgi:hypothetical protein
MEKTIKFRRFIYLAVVIIFVLALSPKLVQKTAASPGVPVAIKAQPTVPALDKKLIEKVGMYVLGITDLNIANGSYTMDVYLNILCSAPCNTPDPTFEIMNATGSLDVTDETGDNKGNTSHHYRVRVPLGANVLLNDFPFDYHLLNMQMEDKILGTNELVYEFDRKTSGVDKYAVVSGWQVEEEVTGDVLVHDYPIYSEPYSRLVFNVGIYHPWFSSFMKGLFAAIVIVMVGMLSFLMKYDEISERLALTSSTLVGAILYHLTLTSSIPPVGYMTFADKFMLSNYIIVFLALAVTVRLMLYVNAEEKEKALWLHNLTRWSIPGLWILSTVYLIVFGMSIPLSEYIRRFGF